MAELRSDSRIIVPHVVVMQARFFVVILSRKPDTRRGAAVNSPVSPMPSNY